LPERTIRIADPTELFDRMMPAGPEDGRDPLHVVPTRVPTGRRWPAIAIGASAVVVLLAGVLAAVLQPGTPGGSSGVADTTASPFAVAGQSSSGDTSAPEESNAGSSAPSAGATAVPPTRPPTTPWVPGPPGRITLVKADGSLAIIDDTTGATTPIHLDGRVTLPPAWSPDGSRLAAIDMAPFLTNLEVVDRQGDVTVLYGSPDEAPFYLQWSPDGARVGFLAEDIAEGISLRTAMADGIGSSDGVAGDGVLRRGAPLYFAWPETNRLLLHVGIGGQAFTGAVGLSGQGVGAALPGTGSFRVAAAGRDSVAYVTDGSKPAIILASPDGRELARMTGFGPAAMGFDPGGTRLAAIASLAPADNTQTFPLGPLRVLDRTTGTVRTLVDDGAFAFYWSPDGATVAVLRLAPAGGTPSADRGAVRLAAADQTPRPSSGVDVHVTFVDAKRGTVRSDRVVRLGSDYVDNVLPYFDQYALSHPVWSPDSRAIVLPLVDDADRTMATVLSVDGKDPRPIAEALYATWSP
jgi:TolB protein